MDEYEEQVGELGDHPDKGLIDSLSIVAGDVAAEYAPAIAEIVLRKIREAAPNCKVPRVYLVDSIIKNHPDPYVQILAPRIVSTFCATFDAVGNDDRQRLVRLLHLWRKQRCFPIPQIEAMEQHVRIEFRKVELGASAPPLKRPRGGAASSANRARPAPPAPADLGPSAAEMVAMARVLRRVQDGENIDPTQQLSVHEIRRLHPEFFAEIRAMAAEELRANAPPRVRPTAGVVVVLARSELAARREDVVQSLCGGLPFSLGAHRFASSAQLSAFAAEQHRRDSRRLRARRWLPVLDVRAPRPPGAEPACPASHAAAAQDWGAISYESDEVAGAGAVAPSWAARPAGRGGAPLPPTVPPHAGGAAMPPPLPGGALAARNGAAYRSGGSPEAPRAQAMVPADESCAACTICGDRLEMEICRDSRSKYSGQWVFVGAVRNPAGPSSGPGSVVHSDCL